MRSVCIIAGAVLGALAASAHGQGGIFDIGEKRATRAVVTFGEALPELGEHGSDMTRLVAGVAADLRGKDLAALRACVPANPFLGDTTGAERAAVVHLSAGPRDGTRRVEIVRTPDHAFVAVQFADAGGTPARAELTAGEIRALLMAWPQYRGGFEESACADPRASVFEVPRPYAVGWFFMDKPTMGDRFVGASTTNIDESMRDLAKETLYARLPRGYNPRTPAGLLIWINSGDTGEPPGLFAGTLDELGIICIGAAESGNARHVADRYQLAFDGLATATRRWHVDPRRVYVTGMSGGGRVSGRLQGCFADVFMGAVPITALDYCENVPNGVGQFWRAGYNRPSAPLFRILRQRPIAPITGRKDANYLPITHAVDLMRRDGLDVKVFGDPAMGHEMPTPEDFNAALTWVDRVWKQTRDDEVAAAEKAMEAYRTRFGDGAPRNEAARRMLIKVTEAGAWTDAAWGAVEMLKK